MLDGFEPAWLMGLDYESFDVLVERWAFIKYQSKIEDACIFRVATQGKSSDFKKAMRPWEQITAKAKESLTGMRKVEGFQLEHHIRQMAEKQRRERENMRGTSNGH